MRGTILPDSLVKRYWVVNGVDQKARFLPHFAQGGIGLRLFLFDVALGQYPFPSAALEEQHLASPEYHAARRSFPELDAAPLHRYSPPMVSGLPRRCRSVVKAWTKASESG